MIPENIMKTQQESPKISKNPVEFITKLQCILQNCPNIVSYSQDGKQIIIHNFQRFTNQVLPHYFRHNKWKSFIRQMNMYGFRKICREIQTQIFINDLFYKGNQHNFYLIQRKNIKNQQPQIQPNYEQQVFQIITQESILNGIPPYPKLLQFPLFTQNHHHTAPTLPSFSHSLHDSSKKPTSHLATSLENLDHKQQNKYFMQNQSQQETQQQKYMNSILFFIKNTMQRRKKLENFTQKLKNSLNQINKNPKNKNNSKSHQNLKESFKIIDQASNQMKNKMQQYIKNKAIPQKKILKSKKQISKPLIPIIPQRISPRLHNTLKTVNPSQNQIPQTSCLFNMMLDSFPFIQKAQRKDSLEQQLQIQFEANNHINNNGNIKRQNDEGSWLRNSKNGINNGNLVNKLGLSSMCSFSSVTNLLNFDKE